MFADAAARGGNFEAQNRALNRWEAWRTRNAQIKSMGAKINKLIGAKGILQVNNAELSAILGVPNTVPPAFTRGRPDPWAPFRPEIATPPMEYPYVPEPRIPEGTPFDIPSTVAPSTQTLPPAPIGGV